MLITKMGLREVIIYNLISLILAFGFIMVGTEHSWCYWLLICPLIMSGFVLYFFRDPSRTISQDPNAIVSPADGVVTHIEKISNSDDFPEEMLRISIFLSIFDVHLNRSPFPGSVTKVEYKKGEFLNAMSGDSLHRNECNTITFSTKDQRLPMFAVRQIAGLIARRIVCLLECGDSAEKGERIGMMKFSSRTDLFVPAQTKLEVNVKVGDKVYAGTSILAMIKTNE